MVKKGGVTLCNNSQLKQNKMKAIIKATVPTVYQYSSINAFGMNVTSNPDGSFSINEEFPTRAAAVNYLKDVAFYMFDDVNEMNEAIKEVKEYGQLSYDACTARIEKI